MVRTMSEAPAQPLTCGNTKKPRPGPQPGKQARRERDAGFHLAAGVQTGGSPWPPINPGPRSHQQLPPGSGQGGKGGEAGTTTLSSQPSGKPAQDGRKEDEAKEGGMLQSPSLPCTPVPGERTKALSCTRAFLRPRTQTKGNQQAVPKALQLLLWVKSVGI